MTGRRATSSSGRWRRWARSWARTSAPASRPGSSPWRRWRRSGCPSPGRQTSRSRWPTWMQHPTARRACSTSSWRWRSRPPHSGPRAARRAGSPAPVSATSTGPIAQMVAQHTVGGCNLHSGDLIGTGTISGPTPQGGWRDHRADPGRACADHGRRRRAERLPARRGCGDPARLVRETGSGADRVRGVSRAGVAGGLESATLAGFQGLDRDRSMERVRWFLSAFQMALCCLLLVAAPAGAQSPPAPDKVRALLEMLADPEIQRWVEQQRQAPAPAGATSAPAASADDGGVLAGQIDAIRQHMASLHSGIAPGAAAVAGALMRVRAEMDTHGMRSVSVLVLAFARAGLRRGAPVLVCLTGARKRIIASRLDTPAGAAARDGRALSVRQQLGRRHSRWARSAPSWPSTGPRRCAMCCCGCW
jgi:hypothetical protein